MLPAKWIPNHLASAAAAVLWIVLAPPLPAQPSPSAFAFLHATATGYTLPSTRYLLHAAFYTLPATRYTLSFATPYPLPPTVCCYA